MDAGEIALLVVIATDFRNRTGTELRTVLMDFHTLSAPSYSTTPLNLSLHMRRVQADKALVAGMSIWLHTARAAQDHRLRFKAKQMWAELARGFPLVHEAEQDFYAAHGKWPILMDAGSCPDGLNPAA